jgi:hypothetical protein
MYPFYAMILLILFLSKFDWDYLVEIDLLCWIIRRQEFREFPIITAIWRVFFFIVTWESSILGYPKKLSYRWDVLISRLLFQRIFYVFLFDTVRIWEFSPVWMDFDEFDNLSKRNVKLILKIFTHLKPWGGGGGARRTKKRCIQLVK